MVGQPCVLGSGFVKVIINVWCNKFLSYRAMSRSHVSREDVTVLTSAYAITISAVHVLSNHPDLIRM